MNEEKLLVNLRRSVPFIKLYIIVRIVRLLGGCQPANHLIADSAAYHATSVHSLAARHCVIWVQDVAKLDRELG